MAKHRYDIDESRIAKWLAEGRGEGRGEAYKPWLRVQDLSSRGRSSRMPGRKSGRTHELMSDLERAVLLEFDGLERVVDIREQFPLPRETTIRIAQKAGIRHPAVHGVDIVMTTDFVVDFRVGSRIFSLGVAVKYAKDLESGRTVEKLELERRYWLTQKSRWIVVTELDLVAARTAVSLWKHGWHTLEHLGEAPEYWADRCEKFISALSDADGGSLLDLVRRLEAHAGFAVGDGMTVVRHLLATGEIVLAENAGFDPRGPATQLLVSPAADASFEKAAA
jgi:hypothetical protein